ncbi:nucleotide exchange factor GrpE [Miniphocaeibacter halophilus]|uniref:Nucleotide exchange factor GrpE n=1 Tax=Miniphocaeibacter halophilus TaxID=2931922 RepID=A0AC61MPZ8_9FIRM|nr:nucleotide exchange factor GrpE [Miniphocaeibacter halophilus]QQK07645.1 nucleotide exchange factor GrpE [Miniphocaeibacter halophilus]
MAKNKDKKTNETFESDENKENLPNNEENSDEIESNENELLEENESLKNSLTILQADFINFKKRIEKEKSQSISLANEGLIMKLLPIVDDLERAYENKIQEDEFSEGIKIILDNFKEILKREGLEEIESKDTLFDHNVHQAILVEKNDEVESGYIIDTLQKGYKLNGKIIRPSMVKVSE